MALSAGGLLDALSQNQTRELQQLLIKLGYDPGPVDGIMGPQTKGAYQRFLEMNGGGDVNYVQSGIQQLLENNPEAWAVIRHGNEITVPAPTPRGDPAPPAPAPAPQASSAPQPAATGTQPTTAAPTTGPVNADAVDAWVREHMPSMAPYLDHAELGPILREAAQFGWSDAQLLGRVQKTQWYQTTSEAIRSWDLLSATDPASAISQIYAKGAEIANLAARLGINFTKHDSDWLAGQSLRERWTQDQLMRYLGNVARNGGIGAGSIQAGVARLKGTAAKYMASMNDKDAMEYSIRIMEGSTTDEAVETTLRDQARGRFYWLRDQIDRGITPEQLFSPIRQAVAGQLEMNEDDINFNDPKWSALTAPMQDQDKSIRSMNFHEAQTWARKQAEWRYTGNANEIINQRADGLLKTLGAIA